MSKFLQTLKSKPFSLIVSLPRNDIDMAKAAWEGGADAIKVHINIEHRASGTYFGPFEEEKETIQTILDEVDIPVGIVPGSAKVASKEEILSLANMGIDFFDIYIENIPSYMLELPTSLGKMYATSCHFDLKLLPLLNNWEIEMLEASIMSPEDYGRDLRLSDLLLYQWLSRNSKCPVIVPTQLAIKPAEIPFLYRAEVKSIMIGAIVTGKEAGDIYEATMNFKKIIDEL